MAQPNWETVWPFLTKLYILLPYDIAAVLLVVYSKEMKTVHTKPACRCL